MKKQIIRISLDQETDGKKLEFLMKKHLHTTPQEELRYLVSTRYEQETSDELKYAPKQSARTLTAEARAAKIKEMEAMSPTELRDELFALGLFEKVSWEDPEFRGVTQSYEVREANGEKVLGVLYETKDGGGDITKNWNIVYTWAEILKELSKKKLI